MRTDQSDRGLAMRFVAVRWTFPVGMSDSVALVDEHDAPLGVSGKLEVHRRGRLHRAFSVFGFDAEGELLLQQRALGKYHCGGLWSNAGCGHRGDGEDVIGVAPRRLLDELGMACVGPRRVGVLPYRTEIGGLAENELDHLVPTRVDEVPMPNPHGVASWRYVSPAELSGWLTRRPADFTAWFARAWAIVTAQANAV